MLGRVFEKYVVLGSRLAVMLRACSLRSSQQMAERRKRRRRGLARAALSSLWGGCTRVQPNPTCPTCRVQRCSAGHDPFPAGTRLRGVQPFGYVPSGSAVGVTRPYGAGLPALQERPNLTDAEVSI